VETRRVEVDAARATAEGLHLACMHADSRWCPQQRAVPYLAGAMGALGARALPRRRDLLRAAASGATPRRGAAGAAAPTRGSGGVGRAALVKLGIVVPFSWSFHGGVVEHAESQAQALRALGVEVRLIMGADPRRRLSRASAGGPERRWWHEAWPPPDRPERPPAEVISLGRSVLAPANGARSHVILTPLALARLRRALRAERFDLLHLHDPMAPIPCVAALALAQCPCVATFHAAGELGWMHAALPLWGFLAERLEQRIAVSAEAAASARRWLPGEYTIVPNGTFVPAAWAADGREDHVIFTGRNEPRKGLGVLLSAWPQIRRATGLRLRIAGCSPDEVRALIARTGVEDDGIEPLGFLPAEALTTELGRAKALIAPSTGQESFGMALTRAMACGTPVVASDIEGYRNVASEDVGVLVPPGDPSALAQAVVELVADETRRRRLGGAARALAQERWGWASIAARLLELYGAVL
jgi:phosphatidyl-myo-inositol alpha-mannosyltransferase